MRIARFSVGHYRVPREVWWGERRIGASGYEISDLELVTFELETEDEVRGTGFTYTIGRGGAAVRAMLEQEVGPLLLGADCRDVRHHWHRLHRELHFVGNGGVTAVAIAAADIAQWDALACEAGLPLYRFLGAHRDQIDTYASGVNLAYSLEELVDEMNEFRDAGFSAVKMKVGRTLAEDVERVGAVRAAIGERSRLMVDANMGWTQAEAARRLRVLDDFDLYWLEEPLVPHDVEGHAALQRQTATPIAAGETLFTPHDFGAYFRAQALRIPQPDVIRLGVTGWLQVAELADAFGLPVAPHFIPEIHVHLACAVPNALTLEYLPILERLLVEPLAVRDGLASPSQGPGHGMHFSHDLLAGHRLAP
jgi:L-alanine-DL-glutamate epimerase-like enolase superfamily enzyme